MSKRNRQLPAHPEKGLRREDSRRDRHRAKELLVDSPEDAGQGSTIRRHRPPEVTPMSVPGPVKTSTFKHWKQPFWKRRNAERHRKNEMLNEWARSGPPPIVLEEPVEIPKAAV